MHIVSGKKKKNDENAAPRAMSKMAQRVNMYMNPFKDLDRFRSLTAC